MKRTFIKKALSDLFRAMDQNGYKQCEIMSLNLKTCINGEGELFVHAEATISEPGEDGKTYMVEKDFDL